MIQPVAQETPQITEPSAINQQATASMPFLAHLQELRTRIGYALIGITLTTIIALIWSSELFALLTSPLRSHFQALQLIGTGPAEAFFVKLKVGFVAGLILSSPFSFLQLWSFISPGLHTHERRNALPFVIASTLFFLAGISFCFFVVFPFAFQYFSEEFVSIDISPNIRIGEYLSFAVKMLLMFGLVFELPILSYFLTRIQLLHYTWLIKNFRYSVIAIFVIAGILTPPDVITQLLLAFPMLALYGLCIGVSYWVNPTAR